MSAVPPLASGLTLISFESAAKVGSEPIVLKNPIFGEIDGIFHRTAQPAFLSAGIGQIGLPPLMYLLTAPHEQSHLTSWNHGLLSEFFDI